MENLTLLERFADVELLKAMPIGEKMVGSLIVTFLGMGVTFLILTILWGVIALMTKMLTQAQPKKEAQPVAVEPKAVEQPTVETAEEEDDEELVAVITAAVAASLQTSIHNIYVRNIVRVPDMAPVWGRTARLDQMNSRF